MGAGAAGPHETREIGKKAFNNSQQAYLSGKACLSEMLIYRYDYLSETTVGTFVHAT